MKRILTLQVEIEDKGEALWIWYSHMNNKPEHGVMVQVIQEGKLKDIDDDGD